VYKSPNGLSANINLEPKIGCPLKLSRVKPGNLGWSWKRR